MMAALGKFAQLFTLKLSLTLVLFGFLSSFPFFDHLHRLSMAHGASISSRRAGPSGSPWLTTDYHRQLRHHRHPEPSSFLARQPPVNPDAETIDPDFEPHMTDAFVVGSSTTTSSTTTHRPGAQTEPHNGGLVSASTRRPFLELRKQFKLNFWKCVIDHLFHFKI